MTSLDLWSEARRNRADTLPEVQHEKKIKSTDRDMRREWRALLPTDSPSYEGTPISLDPSSLDRHKNLRKAESTITVQLRTGVLGLNSILSRLRVPGISEACRCGTGVETVAHFLIWCPLYTDHRRELRTNAGGGPLSIRHLLNDPTLSKGTAQWAIRSQRFEQFTLARTLLFS